MSQHPPMTLDRTMPFGKHKGTKIHDLIENEWEYVSWLVNETDVELDNDAFQFFQESEHKART